MVTWLDRLLRATERQRRPLLLVVAIVTMILACGLPRVRLRTGLFDWLPQSHPHVVAFRELFDEVPQAVSQEVVWLELEPEAAARLGVERITDRGAFLAQAELVSYVRERVPRVASDFGALALLGLATPGARPEDPLTRVPSSEVATAAIWTAIRAAAGDGLESVVPRDGVGTVLTFIVDAPPLSDEARSAGLELEAALAAYATDPSVEWPIFRKEFLVPTGLASGTAFIDRELARTLATRTPLALVLLAAVLWVVLRSWRSTVLVIGVVGTSLVWTLGAMGLAGAPIHIVTMALVPFVLGSAINAAILVSVELGDRIREGEGAERAVSGLARGAARAVVLTTCTTIAGLVVLCASDAPGLVSLGLQAAVAVLAVAFLSIAVLPALVAGARPPAEGRLAGWAERTARKLGRHRHLTLGLAAAAVFATTILAGDPVLLLDVVDGHFRPTAPLSRCVGRIRERCGGAFPELVILRGDVRSDEARRVLDGIRGRVLASSGVLGEFRTVGLAEVRAVAGARSALGLFGRLAGASDDGGRAVFETLERQFESVDGDMAVLVLVGGGAASDLDSADELWQELEAAVVAASAGAEGLEVSFLGYRTMARLFTRYGLRQLEMAGLLSTIAVLVIAAFVLRSVRAAGGLAVVLVVSGVVWYGLLRLAGVWLSVFLLFPLVYTLCVASDGMLHLVVQSRASPPRRVWRTTGRAILLAAATDTAVFLAYAGTDLTSVTQIMVAVALAVVAASFATWTVGTAILPTGEERQPEG